MSLLPSFDFHGWFSCCYLDLRLVFLTEGFPCIWALRRVVRPCFIAKQNGQDVDMNAPKTFPFIWDVKLPTSPPMQGRVYVNSSNFQGLGVVDEILIDFEVLRVRTFSFHRIFSLSFFFSCSTFAHNKKLCWIHPNSILPCMRLIVVVSIINSDFRVIRSDRSMIACSRWRANLRLSKKIFMRPRTR